MDRDRFTACNDRACGGRSIKAFLVKPVSPSSLHDAMLEAMGHGVEKVVHRGVTVPVKEQLRGARMLLVEDNEINQQVTEELVSQAGIQVTIAKVESLAL